jgi:hypothetical protein
MEFFKPMNCEFNPAAQRQIMPDAKVLAFANRFSTVTEMNRGEVLERLHFVDTKLNKVADVLRQDIPLPVFKDLYDLVRTQAEQLEIEEIRRELFHIDPRGQGYARRFVGCYCKAFTLDPLRCCVDGVHNPIGDVPTSRGMSLLKVLELSGPKTKYRINRVCRHFNFFATKIPVVVAPSGHGFEVVAGNHRVMAAIKKGLKTMTVLCICDEDDDGVRSSFELESPATSPLGRVLERFGWYR